MRAVALWLHPLRIVKARLAGPISILFFLINIAAAGAQPIVWTGLVNATASGATIQKTAGCDGCEDAGGVSQQQIAGGLGGMQFAPGSGQLLYAGLTHTTATPLGGSQIDYAFAIYANNSCEIREFGVWKADCAFAAGDVLAIKIESGPIVRYYRNGAIVFTSAAPPAGYPYVLGADLFNLGATVANAQMVAVSSLVNWTSADVGAVGTPGSASSSGSVFTVRGAGSDIGGTADSFQFVYQSLTGDGDVVARLDSVENTNALAKAGVMLRDGVDAAAAHVTLVVTPAGVVSLLQRASPGANTRLQGQAAVILPAWLKLSRAKNKISGSVSIDGTTWLPVGTATANLHATLEAGMAVTSHDPSQLNTSVFESPSVRATASPSPYTAISDRDPRPKPPLPALGPAGFQFTDPVFGSRILRVTDDNTRPGFPGRSFTAPSAAHQLAWNAASNMFYVRSIDGTFIPYSFDAASMRASRISPAPDGDGGLTIQSQAEPQFSFVSSNLLFGSRQDAANDWPVIRQFDFGSLTYTDILNLGAVTAIAQHTYAGAISSSATTPEKLCVLFGGSQDTHYKVAVFLSSLRSTSLDSLRGKADVVVLDSLASTITSKGIAQPTNVPLGVYLHHAWMDQSGRYVILYTVNQQPVPYYVWDLKTNTITAVNTNAGGHDATGFGQQVNQACCTTVAPWDGAEWQLRALGNPAATTDLVSPVLSPQEVYIADHTSWNNARGGASLPVLSSLYRYYNGTFNTTPWRAWDDEIVAIETDAGLAGATVWRFAHHRSDITYDGDPTQALYFWYTPIAVVSPDGKWAIFTSNWEKTLGAAAGSDAQPGGQYRCDVFLVQLR